jgi:hypothetical protein
MKKQAAFSEVIEQTLAPSSDTPLDVVVPFTNPAATRSALHAAAALTKGLNAAIRLLKVQVVCFPLPMDRSPVELNFLKEQLRRMAGRSPISCEIRLARDFELGLQSRLREDSMVVVATPWRPWRTHAERLAGALRRAGYAVLLVPQEGTENNA